MFFPIAAVAFLGALAMILLRALPLKEAYDSIEWPLLMLIAGMMALGMAMESTGTAEFLAKQIIALHQGPSPYYFLAAFFILTVLLTQPLSNAAAALVVLPIAVHVAIEQGVNPRSFAMAVSIAAPPAPFSIRSNRAARWFTIRVSTACWTFCERDLGSPSWFLLSACSSSPCSGPSDFGRSSF